MRSIATPALDAIEAGTAIIAGAVEILADDPVRVWSGHWPVELEGEVYLPLGDREIAIGTGASIGGLAQNLQLSLSGIEPEALALLETTGVRGAPVKVWSLIFDGSGTVFLDGFVHRRGRVDRMIVRETSGGTASITIQVESPGRGLGRRTGRLRSDADQRLIKSNDGGFRRVSFAAERTLYWGGRRPSRAGSAVGGGGNQSRSGYSGRYRPNNR